MGGVFKDSAHTKDAISASLTRERTEPVRPCPECGAETRPHGKAPRESSTDRICSHPGCKTVQAAMPEVPRIGPGDQRPRFPCGKCERETKIYKAGRTGVSTKRICVRPTCHKIIETAS